MGQFVQFRAYIITKYRGEIMPVKIQSKLIKKEQLKNDIFKFAIKSKEMAEVALPGQFLEIRVNDDIEPFLRRPISIYNMNKENGTLEIIFRVQGKGTEILSKRKEGEFIDIIGPLGYGTFKFEGYKNIAILGGGIGVFPLYELVKQAKEVAKVNTYLGFRNKEAVLLEEEFKDISDKLVITTDDGSYKIHGFAINELKNDLENIDCIFACGPLPLLKAAQSLAKETNIPCQVSLEEKMGCGLGVCLGCAVEVVNGGYEYVCKQGPVFDSNRVII